MPKPKLRSIRRAIRFDAHPTTPPVFRLPERCSTPLVNPQKRAGFQTYYLSCDIRSLTAYLPHVEKHYVKGFRAAVLAKSGLVFEAPSVVVVGLQDGDTFEHAYRWAMSNPIEEAHLHFLSAQISRTPKLQAKAQERFATSIAVLEGVADARKDAEAELDAATRAILDLQGTEAIFVEDAYYDVSYTRERLFLKKRPKAWFEDGYTAEGDDEADDDGSPEKPITEDDEPVRRPKKAAKKRAAKRARRAS